MKIKLSKTLREKVSILQSRVKEPSEYERTRKVLYAWTISLCLLILPIKFMVFMNMDMRFTGFLCGFIMLSMCLLISMVQPGTKTFWLLFANMFITLPLVSLFFPFDFFLGISNSFEALFGLMPLWIPIGYLFFFTWKNIRIKKKHREQFVEKVKINKKLKLKKASSS